MTDSNQLFGEVIHTYTRKQAIEDGYQIGLATIAADGKISLNDQMLQMYKFPVFLTSSVYEIIDKAVNNKQHCNSWTGVLRDIIYMSVYCSDPIDEATHAFTVRITGARRKKDYRMVVKCGPMDIDDPTPTITIMMPEDM